MSSYAGSLFHFLTICSVYDTTELFFVGVGTAHHGILHLLDVRRKMEDGVH